MSQKSLIELMRTVLATEHGARELGKILAQATEWDGSALLEIASFGLADANFSDAAADVARIRERMLDDDDESDEDEED